MSSQPYVYPITQVVKVTDGDTYWFRVDVGFRALVLVNCRLLGFDCPERTKGSAFERFEGAEATMVADEFLNEPGSLWVRTEKDPDSFGRWLGEVWREDGDERVLLGDMLRAKKLASVWPTRWHEEFDQADPK